MAAGKKSPKEEKKVPPPVKKATVKKAPVKKAPLAVKAQPVMDVKKIPQKKEKQTNQGNKKGTDEEINNIPSYNELYDRVMTAVTEQLKERENSLTTDFNSKFEQSSIGMKNFVASKLKILPTIVLEAVVDINKQTAESNLIFQNNIQKELHSKTYKSSNSREDFIKSLQEVTENIIFDNILKHFPSKLDVLRYL